jgi:tyrosyl-tRNA synthetase
LKVPSDSNVGDRIIIEGYDNTKAEVAPLNPKKKVWDKIQSELKTNSDGEVLWREFSMLTVNGDRITSIMLNCNVK